MFAQIDQGDIKSVTIRDDVKADMHTVTAFVHHTLSVEDAAKLQETIAAEIIVAVKKFAAR